MSRNIPKENYLEDHNFLIYKSFAEKALSWLNNNLENFTPFNKNNVSMSGLKVFSEICLIYTYLNSWKNLGLDSEIKTWHSFFTSHLENQVFAQAVRRKPEISYALMFPYLLLRSTGYRSEYYEDSFKYMKRWGLYESVELVPYRKLDLEFFLWKSGFNNKNPKWKEHFNSTVLGRCYSPLILDENAAYSVTHTLFYMTDFSNQSLPLSQKQINRVTNIVEALLINFWRVGHFDLMGELLINLNCLNKDDTYLYQKALNAFFEVWNEDGSIPGRINDIEKMDKFTTCYHTTLVALLLCSIGMNKVAKKEAV